MDPEDALGKAREVRRSVLGDEYVDAQTADPNPTLQDFQDHLTAQAWGVWTREGPLTIRDRSLLVIAMTAALGRMDEFKIHVRSRGRTGVTDDELDELLFQIAAYCGVPAGVAAKRALLEVRGSEEGAG